MCREGAWIYDSAVPLSAELSDQGVGGASNGAGILIVPAEEDVIHLDIRYFLRRRSLRLFSLLTGQKNMPVVPGLRKECCRRTGKLPA